MSSSSHNGSDRDLSPADDAALPISAPRRSRSSEAGHRNASTPGNNANGRTSPSDEAGSQDGGEEEDLFGDEASDVASPPVRKIDDEELDSGDDEGRRDRVHDTVESENFYGNDQNQYNIMESSISRVTQPEAGDGELYFFHAPAFLSIDPHEFDIESYTPPTKEHHKRDPPDNPAKFSSFSTASTKLHWRHSPNSDELQSNARIVRWSDGSLTLQMASNPREQYAIPAKPLSAPQINPPKRTPLSVQTTSPHDYKPTGPNPESNTYLAVGVERMGFYRNIAHFTTSLTPLPNTLNEDADNAISMLRDSLAATRRLSTITPASSSIVVSLEDPEKARRDAEYLEKEKLKLDRRNKSAQDRVATRDAKATARRYGGTGLSAHDLEREDGMPTTTKSRAGKGNPTAAARQRRRAANRRGEIYSDDDEGYGARGHTKEDEYDVDDGFLVGSDEEEEVVEESEEEDLDAEGEEETPPPTRPAAQSSSKPQLVRGSPTATRVERDRASPKRGAADDEEGAGGPARVKRRLVVEDEDDDE